MLVAARSHAPRGAADGGAIFAISYHGANEVIENEDPLPVASREVELEGSRPR
jgi:hypothetical protein